MYSELSILMGGGGWDRGSGWDGGSQGHGSVLMETRSWVMVINV